MKQYILFICSECREYRRLVINACVGSLLPCLMLDSDYAAGVELSASFRSSMKLILKI